MHICGESTTKVYKESSSEYVKNPEQTYHHEKGDTIIQLLLLYTRVFSGGVMISRIGRTEGTFQG